MKDNNTSGFNYRIVKGSKVLSAHSYGMAIDINPMQNPYVKGKTIQPSGAKYDTKTEGTILRDSRIVNELKNVAGNGAEDGEVQKTINILKRRINHFFIGEKMF